MGETVMKEESSIVVVDNNAATATATDDADADAATENDNDDDDDADNHRKRIDCCIPKGWTGTTPKKTLEDICRKLKFGRPKFVSFGNGTGGGTGERVGGGYKLSGINIHKNKN